MQKKKPSSFRTDLRSPLIACACIGAVLLALLAGLSFLSEGRNPAVPPSHLPYYILGLLGVYLAVVGSILAAYLTRYRRISEANDAADLMTTEISDMFRYVVDIPYAIIGADGMVKIVSGALQSILQFRSPICNVPLSDFCSVPMSEIIGYAQAGEQVKSLSYNEDGVPIDNTQPMVTEIEGRKYDLRCYIMRSRGKDYYFVVFDDVTEMMALKKKKYDEEPVVAYIVIDSLQELAQYVRVSYRTAVSEIETILKEWVAGLGGMIREYEREKYLTIFNRAALDDCIANKFRILETVRNVKLGDNSYPVTISMGVGAIDGSFEDKERAASDALDIALRHFPGKFWLTVDRSGP